MKRVVSAAIFAVLILAGCNGSQPTCPTCPTCPEPITCPPAATCPDCPSASGSLGEGCAGMKVNIETHEVFLDMAQKGKVIGETESQVRPGLEALQEGFEQACQGVVLAEPSSLTGACAMVSRWEAMVEQINLYAPDPDNTTWDNRLGQIINRYCMHQ